MIDEAIQRIGAITERMKKLPLPERPRLPRSEGDLAALFAVRLDLLRAPGDCDPAVIMVENSAEAGKTLAALCSGVSADDIIWENDVPKDTFTVRDFVVGITSAEGLIAATGSVIIPLPNAPAAFPSLLVERHYVVSSHDRLLPDLHDFYEAMSRRRAAGEGLSNYVSITGCSRTADIEKMLIVPAHGPRQIRVLLSRQTIDLSLVQRSFRNE